MPVADHRKRSRYTAAIALLLFSTATASGCGDEIIDEQLEQTTSHDSISTQTSTSSDISDAEDSNSSECSGTPSFTPTDTSLLTAPHLEYKNGAKLIRFIALGDAGTGDDHQQNVAGAMQKVCAERGCDFALYLGDNFYENGVSSAQDQQFAAKFEAPYAAPNFPFYVVLGNHDYGSNGDGLEYEKPDFEIEYSKRSAKWMLPARNYDLVAGPVHFFILDTNAMIRQDSFPTITNASHQQVWLQKTLASSSSPWKIVLGHHPYVSNGQHGNAGNFDGHATSCDPAKRAIAGENLKALVESTICTKAQLYLCGHDHIREWLAPVCQTEFVVSGAGAKLRALRNRDGQATLFNDDSKRGFLWIEADATTLRGVFYDETGTADFERVLRSSAL